jgi:8-oxo-dGTP pyrophosphatase MutT (NUDIX family)
MYPMENITLQLGLKVLLVREDGKFLVLHRSKDKYPDFQGTLWDIPGGRTDPNTSLFENLQRELSEEIGLKLDNSMWEGYSLLEAQDIWMKTKNIHVVRLTYMGLYSGKDPILCDEHDDFDFIDYQGLLHLFPEKSLISQVVQKHSLRIQTLLKHKPPRY